MLQFNFYYNYISKPLTKKDLFINFSEFGWLNNCHEF